MKLVFVSSTFKDMQFERDRLHSHVVPQIDDKLSKYGESIYFGDLRWGVNTSEMDNEESSQKVLSVCLDEIDGCKPYMIVLIGERYGWIPEEILIKETATLKGIEVPSDISVTQLEIEYGALLHPDFEGRILFYFRELDTNGMTESELKDYQGESALHKEKINKLKKRILEIYPNQVRIYKAKWDKETKKVVELDQLMNYIQEDLEKIFLKDIEKENSIPWQQRTMNSASRLFLEKSQNYYPIVRYPISNNGTIIAQGVYSEEHHHASIIHGDIGSGKSAFIANKYYQYTKHKDYENKSKLVPFVYNLDTFSSNAENIIKLILFKYEELLNLDHLIITPEEKLKKEHYFRILELEKKLTDNGLIIFIDNATSEVFEALNKLYSNDSWKPNYPFNDPYINKFYIADNNSETGSLNYPLIDYAKRYVTRILFESEKMPFIKTLIKGKHKELSNIVCQHIIKKSQSCSPFYIKLIVERLLMLDSDDFKQIRAMGDGMDAINQYMISIVDNIADDEEGIVQELANEASQRIDHKFVCRLLSILSCSEEYLSEDEIKEIFAHQKWEYSSLNMSLTTKTLNSFLSIRTSERKYRIVNSSIAKYLREYTWNQGYQETSKIMANYSKNKPHNSLWYKRAFSIATYSHDEVFTANIFNEIYLTQYDESLKIKIKNDLCKQVCDFLQNAVSINKRIQAETHIDGRNLLFAINTLEKIITSYPDKDYTPLLKYLYTQIGVNLKNSSSTTILLQLKKKLDTNPMISNYHGLSNFYVYLNCLVIKLIGKQMDTSSFLNASKKMTLVSPYIINHLKLTELKQYLLDLEKNIYSDPIKFVNEINKQDLFIFNEKIASCLEHSYINTIQKGHAYHTLYQLSNYSESLDYDLIDKAIECYENIDWSDSTILEYISIDDFAEIIQTFNDCIYTYNPIKSADKIIKLKNKLPFYLQKGKELFNTNILDSFISRILVNERPLEELEIDDINKLSDLYMRAISRQRIADEYLLSSLFDNTVKLYTDYLTLFEDYDNFNDLDDQTNGLIDLMNYRIFRNLRQFDPKSISTVSTMLMKHFFHLVTLFDRLKMNENENTIKSMIKDFNEFYSIEGQKYPLCTKIVVLFFIHKYITYNENITYTDHRFNKINISKEKSLKDLLEMIDIYDKTRGGDVRIIYYANVDVDSELKYYQGVMNYIKDNIIEEEN